VCGVGEMTVGVGAELCGRVPGGLCRWAHPQADPPGRMRAA
jgi:hypothetical protein